MSFLKRAAEKDNKEMKRAESELQEIVKSNWGREAQSQQEPSDNSGKNESSDVSSDVVEDDEAGEEIEKERNLDCGEDDEFLTEQSDEDEPGSTTMNVLGSTTLIASNSVEKTGKGIVVAKFWLHNNIYNYIIYNMYNFISTVHS